MSDPAPKTCDACPIALEPAELISDGTCRTRRFYDLAIVALVSLNLIVTCVFGVLGLVDDESKPDPKPSPTSSPTPGIPEPSSPPTGGGEPTGEPTASGEPTPSAPDGCNIFDPECGSTTGGASEGGEG
ncbi:hypothetical protein [Streptomyces ardesiacus]|uniref:hypothetical protein n=1 Tax=Streptomyces ardesiacus TaxID=285564 RepID=UPI000D5A1E84|nr:hypothetical protein [Streptomyces ardesiacus]